MGLAKDFRDFAIRGNMMDLAVGMIIGAAFTSIVKSLVDDVINPVLGIFTGKIDFGNLYCTRWQTLRNTRGGDYCWGGCH